MKGTGMARCAALYLLIFGLIAPVLGAFLSMLLLYVEDYGFWAALYVSPITAATGFIVFFPIWFLLAFLGYLIWGAINAKFSQTILLNTVVFGIIWGFLIGLGFSILLGAGGILWVIPLTGAVVGGFCGVSLFVLQRRAGEAV